VNVIDDVRHFLRTELRVSGAEQVGDEDALLDCGVLDSIEVMQVASYLERQYEIHIEDGEIGPANVGSLAAIARFVERKLARTT
jgi:acyl carrier protein